MFAVFVEQSLLPGQTTPSTTAGVRAGPRACPGTAVVTPNVNLHSTPGKYACLPHLKEDFSLNCFAQFVRNWSWKKKNLSVLMLSPFCLIFRTGPDTVVLNASEPSKEKEKQGFFKAMKKKKKKSQMVSCLPLHIYRGKIWLRLSFLCITCQNLVCPHAAFSLQLSMWLNLSHIGTFTEVQNHLWSLYLCALSLPVPPVMCLYITDGSPRRKTPCHQEMSFPSV